jgi:hypothetical protein
MFSLACTAGEPDLELLQSISILLYSVSRLGSNTSVGTCLREPIFSISRSQKIDTCQVQKNIHASSSTGASLNFKGSVSGPGGVSNGRSGCKVATLTTEELEHQRNGRWTLPMFEILR